MPGTLSPPPWFTGLDDAGVPLDGGLLYVYAAGTSLPLPVFTDVRMTVPHPNPVVLDSAGRVTMYLTETSYKYELRDRFGSLVRTQDDVISIGLGQQGGIGETYTLGGESSTPIINVLYPAGITVQSTHSGTSVLTIDSALMAGDYVLEAMMICQGTVRCALMNLSDGDTETPLVEVVSSSDTGEQQHSSIIVWPLQGAQKTYGVKVRVDALGHVGYVWQVKLNRTSE